MNNTHKTELKVRMFETDVQGHLMGSAYISYANQALWELLKSSGVDIDGMLETGVGPVVLESNIKYLRELRGGDSVTIECLMHFTESKTYIVECRFYNDNGDISAEVRNIAGLLDLKKRKLLENPAQFWRDRATQPEVLGL